jgi:hypothetical protein
MYPRKNIRWPEVSLQLAILAFVESSVLKSHSRAFKTFILRSTFPFHQLVADNPLANRQQQQGYSSRTRVYPQTFSSHNLKLQSAVRAGTHTLKPMWV